MKKRNQRRRRNSKRTLSFSVLEPRKMLAADLGALNLVTNGDFSTFAAGNTTNFYSQDDVTGWNAVNDADGQQLTLFTFQTPKGTLLKLDSTAQHQDRVFQDIDTEAGSDYLISFDMKGQAPNNDASQTVVEDVHVYWDGQIAGTFTSGFNFQTFTLVVQGGSADLSRLEFREASSTANPNGDGQGVLIDNVCVIEASSTAVTNGSFETTTGSGIFFPNGNVDGWNAVAHTDGTTLIKVQDTSVAPTTDGTQYLNLDTSGTRLDHVFTDIDTDAGSKYFVVFDLRSDGDQTTNADELRVRWKPTDGGNDASFWAGTFFGTSTWQTYSISVDSQGDFSRLEFREPGAQPGDGSGPIIDNVRVFEVVEGTTDSDSPTIDINGSANTAARGTVNFIEGSTSRLVNPNIELTNSSSNTLSSATAVIVNSPQAAPESLTVNLGESGLTSAYDAQTGTLTISGTATVATYQNVLRNIRYRNSSPTIDTTARVITVTVTDDTLTSPNDTSEQSFIDLTFSDNSLALAAIQDVTVEAGSPLWVPLSLDNLADGAITFTAQAQDSSLIQQRFADGRSLRVTVDAPDATTNGTATPLSGDMVYQLFEDIVPRPTSRVIELAEDGFYDGVEFHRIIDGFVIQGGDPTATGTGGSTLGDIDDQYDVLLQHNRSGLLSYAKSIDDTNDSQFFITDAPTRSLDYQHSIFGVVTEGDALRASINNVDTSNNPNGGGTDYPTGGITMTDVEVFQDNQNGAILLIAPEGVTGTTTVTVTATDLAQNTVSQTFTVTVEAPNAADSNTNSNPFLNDIPTIDSFYGVQRTFQLESQDVESDDVVYLDLAAINQINSGFPNGANDSRFIRLPTGIDATFDYSVDSTTGLVTVTPTATGTTPTEATIIVAVAPANAATTNFNIDFQAVTIRMTDGLA